MDAGVIYLDALDTADLVVTPVYEEQQVLIAGTDLLTGQSDLSWSDVLELPMCLLTEGMRGRQLIDEALAAQSLELTPRLETDSVMALLAHVGTGRWATIVPHTWARAAHLPGTATLGLRSPTLTAQVALVTSAVQPDSVLARALLKTAKDVDIDASLSGLSSPTGG